MSNYQLSLKIDEMKDPIIVAKFDRNKIPQNFNKKMTFAVSIEETTTHVVKIADTV